MATLRIGTRGSQLALWQANHVAERLRGAGHESELVTITTTGDKITDVPLAKVGTKGMFTKEIEEALAAGHIDLAVHSLKDLPTELPAGFELAAVLEREDPRDVLVSPRFSTIALLPSAARVGTSSLRRQSQLRALRPDLDLHPLRGNVDTRLRKLESGEYAAVILAAAGVKRLGRAQAAHVIPADEMCPAAGQGAMAIEIRAGDGATLEILRPLDHHSSRQAVDCERAMLNALGGGCQVPIGAYAKLNGSTLTLTGVVARPDGSQVLRESAEGADGAELGKCVAEALLKRGADEILRDVYGETAEVPQQP